MSDALAYLVKARPEAMTAYFAFMKDAGSRLDPKTRNLISVITKVHARTENGLKQYLKRALREGATAEEVVDALLMAFPALGLANIVWGCHVIFKLQLRELPGVRAFAAPTAEPVWHDVIAVADLADGKAARLDCDGRGIFVWRKGRTIRVYDSLCPHQSTDIPHLAIEGTRLTCPKHEWAFDIPTGRCVANGDAPLNVFPHKIAGGRLLARW